MIPAPSTYHLILLCLLFLLPLTLASAGDRSYVYQNCLRPCHFINCTSNTTTTSEFSILSFLKWDCLSECKYQCMWHAVDAFQRDGTPVPQFHGKWPFVRFMGVQEPLSVLFSLTNLLAVVFGMKRFCQKVNSLAPMYNAWLVYGLIGINAWFWSIIFHTRDTPFTEKMDYFCALSLVLSSLFVLIVRQITTRRPYLLTAVGVALTAFFTHHIHYLAFVRFDYQYNLTVNVICGLVNALGWLIFCFRRRKRSYVHKCALCVIVLFSLISLEIQDFRPLWWALDAHALWHAGTSPLPIIWFSFAADDCNFIHNKPKVKSKQTQTETESLTSGPSPNSTIIVDQVVRQKTISDSKSKGDSVLTTNGHKKNE